MSDEAAGDDGPDPARVTADADVLAADLLVGGPARDALDIVRSHSWVDLVASDQLLDDAERVIGTLAADELAVDWRDRIDTLRVPVEHPDDDHPGLASAYRGGAAHLLTFDDEFRSAKASATLNRYVSLSVRPPDAFVTLFEPESLHEAVVGGTYDGPDHDPRA